MSVTTQTIWVVDESGATFVFFDQASAENALIEEAWSGAANLTIAKAEAPSELRGDALTDWAIANVSPTGE